MESINKEKKTGEIEAITCVSKSASVPHNHLQQYLTEST